MKFKAIAPGASGIKSIEKAFASMPVRKASKWAGFGETYNDLPAGGFIRADDCNASEVRVWLGRRGLEQDVDFDARGTIEKDAEGNVTERYVILHKITDKVAEKAPRGETGTEE